MGRMEEKIGANIFIFPTGTESHMLLVTGASGFLGKRVCKRLDELGIPYHPTSQSKGTDLCDPQQVRALFSQVQPSAVLHCAAFVGGIQFGRKHPAEMFRNNLLMTINLFDACVEFKVKRLVNPISNCAYPGDATLFKEEEFWNGPLHESVATYGFVRKASWIGSHAYYMQYNLDTINLILSNMYGPEDHFEEERSHALGALIMKFDKAKKENLPSVTVWGTGTPVREWLHADDGAEAMIRALDIAPHQDIINIGIGSGVSIKKLAEMIKEAVGYEGTIEFDHSKPDGAPYKTVDGTKGELLLKWKPTRTLSESIKETVEWYRGGK